MESIKEEIIEIVNANLKEENEKSVGIDVIQEDCDLSQIGMDSITFIHVIVALEEEFNIEIPDEKLLISEMNTVSKIEDVISDVLNTKYSKEIIGG